MRRANVLPRTRRPQRAVAIRALLTLSLMPLVVLATPTSASPIPPQPELWAVNPDGSASTRISEQFWGSFDWSPDGRRIAYSYQGDIFVADPDGTNAVNVTDTPGISETDPAWSPDGREIAFSGLGIVRADGTRYRLLMDPTGARVTGQGPDWSPDGGRLSFVAGPGGGAPAHVFTVAVDGSDREQLSTTDAYYSDTSWSPGAGWIAFTPWGGGLHVVTPDGVNEIGVADGSVSAFEWSSTGTRLLFGGAAGAFIFDTTTRQRMSVVERAVTGVTWSPDDARIAFTDDDIYVTDPTGADPVQITDSHLFGESKVEWSPAGDRLAFIRLRVQVLCLPPGKAMAVEATIIGTEGDDTLTGTEGADAIAGQGGQDVIYGLGADDVICGGDGDDTIYGSDGADVLVGDRGADFVLGGRGNDRSFGSGGPDRLRGGGRHDRLGGGPAADVLEGRGGNDTLVGKRGSDVLRGGPGEDALNGDAGRDFPGFDSLDGARGHDHCARGEFYRGCELSSAEREAMKGPPPTVLRGGGGRQAGTVTYSYCWSYRAKDGQFGIGRCVDFALRQAPRRAEPARPGARAHIRFKTSERPDRLALVLKPRVDENGYPAGGGRALSYTWRKVRTDGELIAWDAVFRLPRAEGDVYPVARAEWKAHGEVTYDWHLRLHR